MSIASQIEFLQAIQAVADELEAARESGDEERIDAALNAYQEQRTYWRTVAASGGQ